MPGWELIDNEEKEDPFALGEGVVGKLTQDVQMKQLDSIYANDSIVQLNPVEDAIGTQGEVEIYEKGGKKLLLISPEDEKDPEATISYIQIFDERFKTDKGLNVNSTFADVKANYEVAAIQDAINSVVVFLKNSDIYLTIDKKQLPENSRYNYGAKIEASQIPDEATIKYFMIGWDGDDEDE